MTDLEIMLMLEEEGYEPSIENVQIFKEEYLDEGLRDAFIEYRKNKKPVGAAKKKKKEALSNLRASGEAIGDARRHVVSHPETHDDRLGQAEEQRQHNKREYENASIALTDARKERNKKVLDALKARKIKIEVPSKGSDHSTPKYEVPEGSDHSTPKYEVTNTPKLAKVNASVEYSDYELYQLLDESGYKPTESNLSILKEGLESGKYEIIDEGFHPIKALQTYRFYTKNYVKPNKKNAKLAKEDPESTEQNTKYWENRYGAAKELRKTATRNALTDRIPEEKK